MGLNVPDFFHSDLIDCVDWLLENEFWDGSVDLVSQNELVQQLSLNILRQFSELDSLNEVRLKQLYDFAFLGSCPDKRVFLQRDIDDLTFTSAGIFLEVGLKSKIKKFWEEHKTEIIIAIAATAALAGIVIAKVFKGGDGDELASSSFAGDDDFLGNFQNENKNHLAIVEDVFSQEASHIDEKCDVKNYNGNLSYDFSNVLFSDFLARSAFTSSKFSYSSVFDFPKVPQFWNQQVFLLNQKLQNNHFEKDLYLNRGYAHFELKNFDQSLRDFKTYSSFPAKTSDVFDLSFSLGFASSLPKGIYESGKGVFLFLADLIQNPIQTGMQVSESVMELCKLVKSGQYEHVAEMIAPEVLELVQQWDHITPQKRGELAGFAFGKLGSDFLLPGGLAKSASIGKASISRLVKALQGLQKAEQVLCLESISRFNDIGHVAKIIDESIRTIEKASDLGFSNLEMANLKSAGRLETAVEKVVGKYPLDPILQASYDLHQRAKEFLKPYSGYMTELECKELIHQTGLQTYPRPLGIPDDWRVKLSRKGPGIIYVHPEIDEISVRVMSGKPHSPWEHQQKPYVIYKKNGSFLDKFGNIVIGDSPEAHIPISEFTFNW